MKRILIFFCAFITFSCNLIKSAHTLALAHINTLNGKAVIPYEKYLSLIIINISIKGKPYRFIFDTGAGATVISTELAKETGFKQSGSISVSDVQKTSQKLIVGMVDTMRAGNIIYANVGVLVNDFTKNPTLSCIGIDGILGINMIRQNNWVIDYEHTQLVATDLMVLPDMHCLARPEFVFKGRLPHIKFIVNGVSENFLIDSGDNDDCISVSAKTHLSEPAAKLAGNSTTGLFGARFDTTVYYKVTSFKNGEAALNVNRVSSGKNASAMIGTGYFEKNYNAIGFDFKNKKLCLPAGKENIPPYMTYGLGFKVTDTGILVGSKFINLSPEIDKGISVGDTIIAINALQVNESNKCAAILEVNKAKNSGQAINLQLLKNKKVVTYVLPLKEI